MDRRSPRSSRRRNANIPELRTNGSPELENRSIAAGGRGCAAPNPGARFRARDGVRRYGRRRHPSACRERLAAALGDSQVSSWFSGSSAGIYALARRGVGRGARGDVAAGRRLLRLCAPRLRQRRGIRGRLEPTGSTMSRPSPTADHGDDVPRRALAGRGALRAARAPCSSSPRSPRCTGWDFPWAARSLGSSAVAIGLMMLDLGGRVFLGAAAPRARPRPCR